MSRAGSTEEPGNLHLGCEGRVEAQRGPEEPDLSLSVLSGVHLASTSPKLVEG
jgi:hypothetical protein